MILPPPCASMPGSTQRVTTKVPRRCVAIISSHTATAIVSTGASVTKPALLTRMSMRPNAARTRSTIARTDPSHDTSACTITARLPIASI